MVLNSVETATHLRGPLCVGRQQRTLLEWQDIIYPEPRRPEWPGSPPPPGAEGGEGRHGAGGNCV